MIVDKEQATETTIKAPETAEQAAYDAARGIEQPAEQPATETLPEVMEEVVEADTPDEMAELRNQVGRIPNLLKRLDDVNGRYGRLSQRIEEMQQRVVAESTSNVASTSADAGELLKDLRDEFPELADKLEGAFSKVMANKGGVDPAELNRILSEQYQVKRQEERQVEVEQAKSQLTEAHPGWQEVINTPRYAEWRTTLPPRVNARITSSQDPFFAAEMLDQHKDWLISKTKKQPAEPSRRLANAVMPSGTRIIPQGSQQSEQEAYDAERAARRRKR
ncbi:MAG: hypothetical protein ACD_23C00889G0004 [uncultured bacterium]|nr:MAG: hypothetical protein ACD_23C00889G0004 [uncultured bacterium]KKT73226.1 MAG: hypothetical protein UW69_C0070G0007 [Microgenomates group bacterium GW2011_GWA2_44_7]